MMGWFVETTIVAAGLSVVAALASKTGRLGPAARHALWLVVLLKMLTPPLVRWPIPPLSRNAVVPSRMASLPAVLAPLEDDTLASPPEIAIDPRTNPEEGAIAFAFEVPFAMIPDDGAMGPLVGRIGDESGQLFRPYPVEDREAEPPSWTVRIVAFASAASRPARLLWLAGAGLFATVQLWRIARYSDRLRRSKPAPEWLVEAIEDEAGRFGVKPPPARLVAGPGSPFLWCGGPVVLVVPEGLLARLDASRWRGILAHEMAHLKRRDPWTCRLSLAAGVLWWWNPLYWLVRSRLASEAEMACDALAVTIAPGSRRAFAEALVAVCEVISARPAAPTLGVGGEGRFLERRLTMILKGRDSGRLPRRGLLAAFLLTGLAAPSWSAPIQDAPRPPATPTTPAEPAEPLAPPEPPAPPVPPAEVRESRVVVREEVTIVDDDDDKDAPPPARRAVTVYRAQPRTEIIRQQIERMRVAQKKQQETMEAQISLLTAQLAKLEAEETEIEKAFPAEALKPRAGRAAPDAGFDVRGESLFESKGGMPEPRIVEGRVRVRGAESGEIDALNRRMDGMEKKLDMLLKELKSR